MAATDHALISGVGWAAVRTRLPPDLDLDASARDHGALRRRRGAGRPQELFTLDLAEPDQADAWPG